jgi:hypothetical protein
MNAVESEVDKLVEALSGSKLAEYILDSRTVSDFARTIAEETGLPRALVRFAFQLLANLLLDKAKGKARWLASVAWRRVSRTLAPISSNSYRQNCAQAYGM